MAETDCIRFVSDIISKYSKIGNTETPAGAEDEFWDWLCSELKNEDLVKCLENAERKDYYGVMDTVKQRYREKCRTLQ